MRPKFGGSNLSAKSNGEKHEILSSEIFLYCPKNGLVPRDLLDHNKNNKKKKLYPER